MHSIETVLKVMDNFVTVTVLGKYKVFNYLDHGHVLTYCLWLEYLNRAYQLVRHEFLVWTIVVHIL